MDKVFVVVAFVVACALFYIFVMRPEKSEARDLAKRIVVAKKDAGKKAEDEFVKDMREKIGIEKKPEMSIEKKVESFKSAVKKVDEAKDKVMEKVVMAESGVKMAEEKKEVKEEGKK